MTEHDDANVPPEMRSDSHAELDTDLRVAERFARLARVDAPNTWDRATRVAAGAPASTDRRWWAAAAAAVLLVVAVVGVAVTRSSDDRPVADDETAVSSEVTEPPASSTS